MIFSLQSLHLQQQPQLIIQMKSIFRIYAKTSKGNDNYLHNQLLSFGVKPKHEDLLHSFYFNSNFNQLFKLSFQSFTVESLYLQIGHKYPLSTKRGQGEKSLAQFFKKTNFRNYLQLQNGIIENITLKILVRESSAILPSENAIVSILQNCLEKQIILKEYRSMGLAGPNAHLQNYYEIKQIIQKKWDHEAILKQQNVLSLQNKSKNETLPVQTNNNLNQKASQQKVSYSPHFILYIRRNHARILLKINRQSMHKFGWKKNIGWAPIKQTLTASILYRTGLIQNFQNNNILNLWDPFCGSGTIPLVSLSILAGLKVRQDYKQNFIWQNWPIYREQYLNQYLQQKQEETKKLKVNIFASDIDISSVQNSVKNFKQLLQENRERLILGNNQTFLNIGFADKVFEVCPNSIYIGCGDFEEMIKKYRAKEGKVNIVTNLPYLGQRSKEHIPIKQLNSIYKRFNEMIIKNKDIVDNVFVIVDTDLKNQNHFIKISTAGWNILDKFNNGGLQVYLLAWEDNKISCNSLPVLDQNAQKGAVVYDETKKQYLTQYRKQVSSITQKRYDLPNYLKKYKGLRGFKRVQQKRKARQLRAAYIAFAERKDKNQVYEKYERKNLALRLSQRGKTWKRKNISLVQNDLIGKQEIIKREFESRIEEALKKKQELKDRKKEKVEKVKRRW